jgi:branched-chain amino acid transport system permease protein
MPASRAPGIAFIFKKALISALVALVLFSLMIGIRTEAGPSGQLIYWTRFGDLAAMVAAVFGGSIVVELLRQWWGPVGTIRIVPPSVQKTLAVARRAITTLLLKVIPPSVQHALAVARRAIAPVLLTVTPRSVQHALAVARRAIAPVLLIFTFLVPVIFYNQRYIIDHGILVLTYVMLGWGLNVVVGLAGLLDLGYVAFYAVGAYSYGLLATNFGLSFWVCLPLAGILAAFWGVMLGFPVLRLRGDYLAIVTLAFGEIIRLVIINWQSLTGGPNGLDRIPRPTLFGIPLTPGEDGLAAKLGIEFSPTHRVVFLFYLILALALLTNWVTIRLRRLPIGRAWEALREDEVACRALGINTTTTKLTAFATGAMFGGFAGAFFATRQGFISPESFTFQESALVLAIVVLGGMGSQLGVALAALTMIGGFELFRGLDQYRMLVFGLAMVLLMIWRPRGLIGHRAPTVFLRHSQEISSDLVKEGHG